MQDLMRPGKGMLDLCSKHTKAVAKEELADHLTIEKGKINKDSNMIGTSKTKDMNFKEL